MNLTGLVGKKLNQTQGFLEDGTRVPLSIIDLNSNTVTQIKTMDRDGYNAVKLGFGITSKANKPTAGVAQKAGLKETPRFFREIRVSEPADLEVTAAVAADEVFQPGDMVDVTGTSKGKGYAGVVKRWGFHGGPRTHGQSDRERAPGSIGQSTTPGRVYKGKKMAGRMGNEQVTIKNLTVMDIIDGKLYIKGLIPGPKGSVVIIKKTGSDKKYTPLFKEEAEAPEANGQTEVIEESAVQTEEVQTEEIKTEEKPAEDTAAEQSEAAETPAQDQPAEADEEKKEEKTEK